MKWSSLSEDWRVGIVACIASTALLTAILAPFQSNLALLNEGLLFLLLTLGLSSVWGIRVGIFGAVLTNLALNFFFIPPLHRFIVHSPNNVVALAVFLIVSITAGWLVSVARAAAERAKRRQAESEALLQLSRALIGQTEPQSALTALCDEAVGTFQAHGAAVLSPAAGDWTVLARAGEERAGRRMDPEERSVADRVYTEGRPEGVGYSGLMTSRRPRIVLTRHRDVAPRDSVTFIPLRMGERPLGVLRLDGPLGDNPFRQEPERLLAAFGQEAALAVQRLELAQEAALAAAWKQADEMKSTLMASISHDLKTPLAGIMASVSGLLDASVAWSEDDKHAFLETIESQADRLNRVISDILDLNRIQSGVVAIEKRALPVRDLIEEATEAAAMETSGHAVVIEAAPPLMVLADRGLMRQALVNLISNAAKYSPAGSPIEVTAAEAEAGVDIVVTDHGPGIAANDLPHIFDSFYRGTGPNRAKGTGLGLAIVKGFVELSGGAVRAESSAAGSRFIVTLPREPGMVAAKA